MTDTRSIPRAPFPNRAETERLKSFVDEAAHRQPRHVVMAAAERAEPPGYGEPQRDAINSMIDGVLRDISHKIGELRSTLDEIEQTVLTSAAEAKAILQEHVRTCIRVEDEVRHMARVVADMARPT
jgi:hypothetical protein